MPLFGFVMWVALKPFRRLTSMVSSNADPFGDAAGAFGGAARGTGRFLKKAAATGVGVYTGNVAAAATVATDEDNATPTAGEVPDRAEARPQPVEPTWAAMGHTRARTASADEHARPRRSHELSHGRTAAVDPVDRTGRRRHPRRLLPLSGVDPDAPGRTRVGRRRGGLHRLPAERGRRA